MTEPLPGPDDQDIDDNAALPTPEELGEEPDCDSATHGDFHARPRLDEVLKQMVDDEDDKERG